MAQAVVKENDIVRFDEQAHAYYVNGVLFPNVTLIMDGVLTDFSKVPKDILETARARGTAVHTACELYDQGILDFTTLDESLYPYLEGWIKFLTETKFQIDDIERIVYSKTKGYAGKLDRRGKLNKRPAIVDIKTSAVIDYAPGVQTAAYEIAGIECGAFPAVKHDRYAVQLDGEGGYQLHPFSGAFDGNVFLSCLNIYRWKLKNGNLKETT